MKYKSVKDGFVHCGNELVPYSKCDNCMGNCNEEWDEGIHYVFCNGDE